jgi:hypothetical protein
VCNQERGCTRIHFGAYRSVGRCFSVYKMQACRLAESLSCCGRPVLLATEVDHCILRIDASSLMDFLLRIAGIYVE